jgi:hypothetical protein
MYVADENDWEGTEAQYYTLPTGEGSGGTAEGHDTVDTAGGMRWRQHFPPGPL